MRRQNWMEKTSAEYRRQVIFVESTPVESGRVFANIAGRRRDIETLSRGGLVTESELRKLRMH